MTRKSRVEIPSETAAEVLFRSDRTCCVCRVKRPVQIHHIDEDPANSDESNLAVLCFDCHRDTQICGGFDRKLDAAQIRRFKSDWVIRVANKRDRDHGPLFWRADVKMHQIKFTEYIQLKESSDEHLYSIDVEYPRFSSNQPDIETELNTRVNSFITGFVDDFRASAVASTQAKLDVREILSSASWDSLSIAHKMWLTTPDYLSIEFVFQTYGAGAAHSNTATRTLNFQFGPFAQLELPDLFNPSADYLRVLSEYCIAALRKEQPSRWWNPASRAEELKQRRDNWILHGAAPTARNYRSFVLENEGISIFFDPYQVGSYAEGRYEVFVPFQDLRTILSSRLRENHP